MTAAKAANITVINVLSDTFIMVSRMLARNVTNLSTSLSVKSARRKTSARNVPLPLN